MQCILMNKNTPVLSMEYDAKHNFVKRIDEIYNIDYAPLAIINAVNNKSLSMQKEADKWFRGRGIPSWRKDLTVLLERLNVTYPEELLNKSYALSLSDQYWLKEENGSVVWENINFFTNDFEYKAYLNAALDSKSASSAISASEDLLKSPNNTTDGMLQKAWIIEDGKRILVKGTYTNNHEEPFNEWLASRICERLNIPYCDYEVELMDNSILVSKCENFITEDEEIVTAYDIFKSEKKANNINDYDFYVQILEKHHVPDARKNVANMFAVDYIIKNFDRHLKNFGVIRNVNTLEWIRTTPVFDTGESMECDKFFNDFNFFSGTGKFFSNPSKDYDDILQTVSKDLGAIDTSKLKGLADEYRAMLESYKDKIDMSDRRIDGLVYGLELRIKKIERTLEPIRQRHKNVFEEPELDI